MYELSKKESKEEEKQTNVLGPENFENSLQNSDEKKEPNNQIRV